jgi:hypothetical protein
MPPPRLTFACELDSARLAAMVADTSVVDDLDALGARVALMLSDLSPERAAAVQRLNAAAIPVVAIPLLPYEQGYYFTADNAAQAAARYQQWKQWTAQHGLVWDGVGLDIEPDVRLYQQIVDNPRRLPLLLAPRLADTKQPRRAAAAYAALVGQVRADGWSVENYQFPFITEERRAGSTLLQRLLGLVDVRTDREVWMLYSSFVRGLGPGMIWSYGPQAQAVAVGSTGGGPDIPGSPQVPTLDWQEFARDLRLARHWCDDLYIHSLEGCVRQGFLGRLRAFDWAQAATPPQGQRSRRGFAAASGPCCGRAHIHGGCWASRPQSPGSLDADSHPAQASMATRILDEGGAYLGQQPTGNRRNAVDSTVLAANRGAHLPRRK